MRRRAGRIVIVAILASAMAAACAGDGPTASRSPVERWQASIVQGQSLPVLAGGSLGYVDYLDSASLEFRPTYLRAVEVQHFRRVFTVGNTPPTSWADTGIDRYTTANDTVIIRRTGFTPAEDWADTGIFSPSALTLFVRRGGARDTWIYYPLAPRSP